MNDDVNESTIIDDGDYGYTDRVEVLRKKEKLKQEDFAEKIGVSTVLISEIERKNKRLSLKNAIEIRKQFNVSLDWIYGLSDDTRDFASNILVDLKDIFDIDFEKKMLTIDDDLSDFLVKITKAYKTREEQGMPDEAFKYWIDGIKNEYNQKLESYKGKTVIGQKKVTYYLQTINEHFAEKSPMSVMPGNTGMPTRRGVM